MATANPTPSPSAQVVGNAFVEQYYHILHHSPELAYRFYQDNSVLSRPSPDGLMRTVKTMKSINDAICSLDYKNYKAEIKTADSQDSFHDGVVLLVTGSLTGNDHQKRKFTQTFFLAPQDTGYFVLNDVFRYVEDGGPELVSGFGIGVDSTASSTLTQGPEPAQVIDPPKTELPSTFVEIIEAVEDKLDTQVIHLKPPVQDKDIVVESESHANENHLAAEFEAAISASEEDAPKKSYASILSSQTRRGPTKVYIPTNVVRVAAAKLEKQPVNRATDFLSSEASTHQKPVTAAETSDIADEDEGHSIYIRNLPLNATVSQLEAEFKKFGPIKPDGIQVRGNRQQGFCFGFVEFQDLRSMQSAIEASPVTIGDRPAVVEAKRTTSRVGSGRTRFTSMRGIFRNDNFRGRGGRAYVRTDSYRERENPREAYQQGTGRGSPRSGPNMNPIPI